MGRQEGVRRSGVDGQVDSALHLWPHEPDQVPHLRGVGMGRRTRTTPKRRDPPGPAYYLTKQAVLLKLDDGQPRRVGFTLKRWLRMGFGEGEIADYLDGLAIMRKKGHDFKVWGAFKCHVDSVPVWDYAITLARRSADAEATSRADGDSATD